MSRIIPFQFAGATTVRSILIDGAPWFVAVDVCKALGISNTTDALKSLDADEVLTLAISEGQRAARSNNVVNESGLYSLVLRSRKPQAKAFKKWVTSEVLPALRRTGTYALPGAVKSNTARGSLAPEFYPPWPLSDKDLQPITRAQINELSGACERVSSLFRLKHKAAHEIHRKIDEVFGAIVPDLEAWQYGSVRQYIEVAFQKAQFMQAQLDSLEALFWDQYSYSAQVALDPARGQVFLAGKPHQS